MAVTIKTATVANGRLFGSDDVQYGCTFIAPNGDTIAALVVGTSAPNWLCLWNCTRDILVGYFICPSNLTFYGVAWLENILYAVVYVSNNSNMGIYSRNIAALDYTIANGALVGFSRVISFPYVDAKTHWDSDLVVAKNSGGSVRCVYRKDYSWGSLRNYVLYATTIGGSAYTSGSGNNASWISPPYRPGCTRSPLLGHDGNVYWSNGSVWPGTAGESDRAHTLHYAHDWANRWTANDFRATTSYGRVEQAEETNKAWHRIISGSGAFPAYVTFAGTYIRLYGGTDSSENPMSAYIWPRFKLPAQYVLGVYATGSYNTDTITYASTTMTLASYLPGTATGRLYVQWGRRSVRCAYAGGAYTTVDTGGTRSSWVFRITNNGTTLKIEYNADGAGWVTLQTYAAVGLEAPYVSFSASGWGMSNRTALCDIHDISIAAPATSPYGTGMPFSDVRCAALAGSGAAKTLAIGYADRAMLVRTDDTTPGVTDINGVVRGSYANTGGAYNVLLSNLVLSAALSSDAVPGSAGLALFGTDAGVSVVDLSSDADIFSFTTPDLPSNTISILLRGGADTEYVGGTPSGAFALFDVEASKPSGGPMFGNPFTASFGWEFR